MKALVTGATGLVGRELTRRLQEPHVLTRSPRAIPGALELPVRSWSWQPEQEAAPRAAFEGVDTVFHLAGEPVAEGRWTSEKKRRIRESRVVGTRHLVEALGQLEVKPRVLVSASGIHYYGSRGDTLLDESSAPGEGFLAEVCRAWEAEAREAEKHGIRVVVARTGMVLSSRGGALARMLPPFRLGVGGKVGSGRQWMSWVHVSDAVGLLLHAAEHEELRGPLNLVSPSPVTNLEFTRTLGHVLQRPTLFTVPKLALTVAFGELGGVLLDSQRVVPRRALDSRYRFAYGELEPALRQCLHGAAG